MIAHYYLSSRQYFIIIIPYVARAIFTNWQPECLVKIAIIEGAVPPDVNQATSHNIADGIRIKGAFYLFHIGFYII